MKRSPIKKTKNKKKLLQKECDNLWQELGRQTYPKCFFCSKPSHCMHHFIRKSQCSKLRYSYKNAIPVCFYHHQQVHAPDPELINQIIETKGKKWLDELLTIKHQPLDSGFHTLKYYKSIYSKLCPK